MRIDSLKVKDFRSFSKQQINLADFNVIIGANSSGKSNFVQIFKFLRDVQELGVSEAVSIQGDLDFLVNIGANTPVASVEIENNEPVSVLQGIADLDYVYRNISTKYFLEVSGLIGQKIVNRQSIDIKFEVEGRHSKTKSLARLKAAMDTQGAVKVQMKFDEDVPEAVIKNFGMYKRFFEIRTMDRAGSDYMLRLPLTVESVLDFSSIGIYDIDPKLAKESSQVNVRNELEENGSNFTKSLKNIIDDEGKRRIFLTTLKDLLPQISSFNVEKAADRSLISKFSEIYSNKYLPSFLMSDGAIYISSLILALQFNREKDIVIIEEPEKYIHPTLIEKLVEYLTEYSAKKQIIITTHSREIVRAADPESLLTAKRDMMGHTTIETIDSIRHLTDFLSAEVGIDDLFSQGLLS